MENDFQLSWKIAAMFYEKIRILKNGDTKLQLLDDGSSRNRNTGEQRAQDRDHRVMPTYRDRY